MINLKRFTRPTLKAGLVLVVAWFVLPPELKTLVFASLWQHKGLALLALIQVLAIRFLLRSHFSTTLGVLLTWAVTLGFWAESESLPTVLLFRSGELLFPAILTPLATIATIVILSKTGLPRFDITPNAQ